MLRLSPLLQPQAFDVSAPAADLSVPTIVAAILQGHHYKRISCTSYQARTPRTEVIFLSAYRLDGFGLVLQKGGDSHLRLQFTRLCMVRNNEHFQPNSLATSRCSYCISCVRPGCSLDIFKIIQIRKRFRSRNSLRVGCTYRLCTSTKKCSISCTQDREVSAAVSHDFPYTLSRNPSSAVLDLHTCFLKWKLRVAQFKTGTNGLV